MRPLLGACALLLFSTGCGPIISTYLIVGAQADLEGAKAAEADRYAVYEYTAASEYLHKAREEQGFADFGPSIDFAYKAKDLAQKATLRAQDEKKKRSEGPPGDWQAPASDPPPVIIKKKYQRGSKIQIVPIVTDVTDVTDDEPQ